MSGTSDTANKRRAISISLLHSIALAVVAIGSIYEWQRGDETAASAVHMLFYTHVAFSLASGNFKGAIAKTWILLVIAFAVMQFVALLGHIIPFAALNEQIQNEPTIGQYVDNFYNNISFLGLSGSAFGLLVFLLFLGFNVAARFKLDEKGEGMTERVLGLIAILLVAIFVASQLLGNGAAGTVNSAVSPPSIVPEWYLLPFLSALRAIPDINGGMMAFIGMLLVPLLAIFITRGQQGTRKWVVRLMLLLCFLGFWGLGYYGGKPVSDDVLLRSQILLACYFAYFLIAPFLTPRKHPA